MAGGDDHLSNRVVFLGPPNAGKGTQAAMLRSKLGVPGITTGDLLRREAASGTPLGLRVKGTMEAGGLVDDATVDEVVGEHLRQMDLGRGFLLDGYPRTRAQAEMLCGMLAGRGIHEVVIHLVVDYNVIIARLTGRRQCPVCGTLYNEISKPPKVPGVCDLDGAKLVVREDDREEVIRQRLEAYEKQTRPLLDYFREKGKSLYEVDASHETPEQVFRKIEALIRKQ